MHKPTYARRNPTERAILTSQALIGRHDELEVVDELLAAVQSQPAAVGLLVRGEPGIGKSALLDDTVLRAREAGLTPLRTSPSEAESKAGLAGVADLLAECADVVSGLPAPQRRALRVALMLAEPDERPADPQVLAAAVLTTMRILSRRAPVLVAIDDLQWLDAQSAQALGFALPRLRDEPVAIVATTRAEPGTRLPLDPLRVVAGGMRELALGPLGIAGLYRLVRDRLGLELSRPELVRLHDACGGNPLFGIEIGRELQEGRLRVRPGAPIPVPGTVLGLVEQRTRRLPATTRNILAAAAVLARPTLETLDAAFGSRVVGRALEQAASAGVIEVGLDDVRFAHPLFASASYSAIPPAARRAVHRRLAEVVGDLEERARHLALGSSRRDAAAADALEHAAEHAAARGAPATAAELAGLAVELTPVADRRATDRELIAAEFLFRSGDAPRADRALRDLSARLPAGALRARTKILMARIAWEMTGSVEAYRLCEAAVSEAEGLDPGLEGEAHTWAAEFSDFDEAARARHARAAVTLLERVVPVDGGRLAAALKALAEAELVLGHGLPRPMVDRAIALQTAHPAARVSDRVAVALGWWLVWTDDLAEARERLEAGHRAAIEEGDESSLTQLTGWLRELELRSGHLDRAREYAQGQLEAAEQQGEALWVAVARARRALVDAQLGRVDEARADAQDALAAAEQSGDAGLALLCHWALGSAALSRADAAEAARWLERASEMHERIGLVEPGYARFQGDLVESLVTLGRLDDADRHLATYAARAVRTGRRSALASAARARALLCSARSESDEALAAIGDSRAQLEGLGMPFESARTALVEGLVLRRLRRRADARRALEESLAGFASVGAALWAARAEAELARTGARRHSDAELSGTERRVAGLAVRGLTNREIAGEVFLTEKSVEDVLRRVYRAIGVRNRTELAARFSDTD